MSQHVLDIAVYGAGIVFHLCVCGWLAHELCERHVKPQWKNYRYGGAFSLLVLFLMYCGFGDSEESIVGFILRCILAILGTLVFVLLLDESRCPHDSRQQDSKHTGCNHCGARSIDASPNRDVNE